MCIRDRSKGSSKGSGSVKGQPVVKKRGTFLTVALVLMTIDAIVSAVLPFVYHRDTVDITRPWLIAAALAVGLVAVAGVVLMWPVSYTHLDVYKRQGEKGE